jgi:hypothetical protein
MYQPLAGLNDLLLGLLQYTPVVQDARENQKQWSKRLEQVESAVPASPEPSR